MNIRTYEELIKIPTFKDRFEYLKLGNKVGEDTFGFDRYLNQLFYRSSKWKKIRDEVIVRDKGYDLGICDYEIVGKIIVHHMNPLTVNDLKLETEYLLDPKFLISTSFDTHNAIHYGSIDLLPQQIVITRFQNDTCLWKH